MKSLCLLPLLTAMISFPLLAHADVVDEALTRYHAMSAGRLRILVSSTEGGWKQTATLAFRRPDRLHYASHTEPGPDSHVWLQGKELLIWTSQLAPQDDAPKNVYIRQPHETVLTEPSTLGPLGPANFVLRLLSGKREELQLDPIRTDGYWTADGDQLIFDPATAALTEVVAHEGDKEVARAQIQEEVLTPPESELQWTLPADAQEMHPDR